MSTHLTNLDQGGMVAMAPLYPLDQVRTLQQMGHRVSKHNRKYGTLGFILDIIEERGWAALYKGHRSVQLALGVSNFIYFYWCVLEWGV